MTVSEYVINVITNFPKEYYNVVIFWKGPFGGLNKRTGFFEEYLEAEEFADHLNKIYRDMDMPYVIYLTDGNSRAKELYVQNSEQLLTANVD